MKKIISLAIMALMSLGTFAQTAQQVLDKTASVIGSKSGASAKFQMSSLKYGSASGTIAIKGNKFNAHTNQATVWYNGKTQWTYLKSTNEVNVSNPTQAQQMSMNPYTFINIYKTGYNATMKADGSNYEVRLVAQNQKRTVQELLITIDKKNFVPSKIKMRQGSSWTNITVSNFKAKSIPNSTFTFNSKDYPKAEIVDLR